MRWNHCGSTACVVDDYRYLETTSESEDVKTAVEKSHHRNNVCECGVDLDFEAEYFHDLPLIIVKSHIELVEGY